MFRRSSWLLATLAVVLIAPVAHGAGWTIGVNGGITKPTGEFGRDFGVGPLAGVDISVDLTDRFAVGVDGSWTRSKHADVGTTQDFGGGNTYTLNKDNLILMSGGVHGKYMFPVPGNVKPYALLGVGVYNVKEDFEETFVTGGVSTVVTDESIDLKAENRFGGKIGAGVMFHAAPMVAVGLQAEYNLVTLDQATAGESSFKFMGVRGVVNFHVGLPK
ncbi:MAG TPA: outer membrane beta-barrel protein [Candidatus Eisenbacteria bacterium]|nr:outer membrane beta-barrel protein [Candidatus Eisenbacteria bacterium]